MAVRTLPGTPRAKNKKIKIILSTARPYGIVVKAHEATLLYYYTYKLKPDCLIPGLPYTRTAFKY